MSRIAVYTDVFFTFARNSLVRDMSFRGNFILESIASMLWMGLSLLFYILVFTYTDEIGDGTGWGKHPFFVFLATSMFVNSLAELLFLPNAQRFSEHIRLGTLDYALVKPIDTQFLISFQRLDFSALSTFFLGVGLLAYALMRLDHAPTWYEAAMYPLFILAGLAILYSVMIGLAAASVWMGRNQSMEAFFFYITTFSRYPMEIYSGPVGGLLRMAFTYVLPILVAINVPARLLAKPMHPAEWRLAAFALIAAAASLAASRWFFNLALRSYRSASS